MTQKDKEYLQAKIDNEGFDYAFIHYSDFKEVKDEKFHQFREAYVKAYDDLLGYINGRR